MADDQLEAAQASQDTPPVQESEESQVEETGQSQETSDETQSSTSENQESEAEKQTDGKTDDQSGQEAKPTRFEKRIQQLSQKLKEIGNQSQTQLPKGTQPYFTKEELEQGEVDPNDLIQRIEKAVEAKVEKKFEIAKMQDQFVSSVKDFQTDLDSVKNLDPDLEAEAAAEFDALNYQINPFTGEREFVPAVKFSEIVNKIETRATKIAEKMAQNIAEGNERHLNQVSSSQAVPSGGTVSGASKIEAETTNFADFEKAYSS